MALVSGLTDVDAITLSAMRLNAMSKLADDATLIAIVLAICANLAFKSGLLMVAGGKSLARAALPGMAATGIGIGIGLAFFSP